MYRYILCTCYKLLYREYRDGVNEKEKRLGCGDGQCMHIELKRGIIVHDTQTPSNKPYIVTQVYMYFLTLQLPLLLVYLSQISIHTCITV